MINFWKKVVKYRVLILIGSVLLLIPATLGYLHTRVNYDVLTYLPDDIETMQGQDILVNDFNTGAFSMFIVDGMEDKDVSALKAKIEQVDHVEKVLWYDQLALYPDGAWGPDQYSRGYLCPAFRLYGI